MTQGAVRVSPGVPTGSSGSSGASGAQRAVRDEPRRPGWRRLARFWPEALLALCAYIPLLLTAPGYVGADTKAYLYLDPDRLLARAPYMWDPHVGAGTVTHQNIGYLLPMGPWYWFWQHVGVPDWAAQRLWTGTLLLAAGAGVMFLLRTFGWPRGTSAVAAFAYAFTPYVLEYEARISAILMPWAGLAWLLGLTIRGLRLVGPANAARSPWRARWRHPALLAGSIALIGSVNATSLAWALLAPLLWIPFAVWSYREVSGRRALGFLWRCAVVILLANLWWLAGLAMQALYGLDVLAFTESIKTVASSSQASEVLRGLGNWYFYGRDGIAAWVQAAESFTRAGWLTAASFALPVLAVLLASCIRWRYRAYFVALVALGTTIAVGVYPYEHPSPAGGAFRDFAQGSSFGLALRSMPRAVPLVALGLAVLLAAGLDALRRSVRVPRAGRRVAFAVAVVLIGLVAAPLWQGLYIDPNLRRPEKLPGYMQASADYMGSKGDATRVLELPGADFSHYTWGSTLDPVPPGLMDRPFLSRELIPYGEPGTADLLRALDRRLQEGVYEPASLPALARLLGVGDVELRSDLQYARFRSPRPTRTWQEFTTLRPAGLGAPKTFGPQVPEQGAVPLVDEVTLGTAANAPEPPAVSVFPVAGTVPIVRAERAAQPLVVAGSGEGLVDASAAGLLKQTGTVLYRASMTARQYQAALAAGADLLLTDSNRRRAERWGTVRENYGYTERAGETPLKPDPSDARLPLFTASATSGHAATDVSVDGTPGDDARTVAEQRGVASVEATDYGNPVAYAPADRPAQAVDGDPTTAWRVGAFADVRGERLKVTLDAPTTIDHLTLTQPLTGPRNRFITKAQVQFDSGPSVDVDLGADSRMAKGQVVRFAPRRTRSVTFRIVDTDRGVLQTYDGISGVGLSELGIPGVRLNEVLRLPVDLLGGAGGGAAATAGHRLVVQLTRDRADPAEPFKEDTEQRLSRTFILPTARAFSLTGTARVAAGAPDVVTDALLGRPTTGAVVTATSSDRLAGDLGALPSSASDGNPATAWTNQFTTQTGAWLQLTAPRPTTLDRLNLQVVADGQHSVPTQVRLEVDGGTGAGSVRTLTLPAVQDRTVHGGTVAVPVAFPAVTGTRFRLVLTEVRAETTRNYFGGGPLQEPVAIAEVGATGLRVPSASGAVTTACRSDLLTVDGRPVPVRVSGTAVKGGERAALGVALCGAPLPLAPGPHDILATKGSSSGLDLDRLVLASAAGGAALQPATLAGTPRTAGTAKVSVRSSSSDAFSLHVDQADTPFWLVLGQSRSDGWHATLAGQDLGAPQLVDGYANGWLIDPSTVGRGAHSFDVKLAWTPQRYVWAALGISAVALVLCAVLGLLPGPHRWRRPVTLPAGAAPADRVADERAQLRLTDGPARLGRVGAGALSAGFAVRAAAVTLGLAVGTALLISPLGGLLALLAALVGLLVPRGRLLLRVAAPACLLVSALYVFEVQLRYHLQDNGQWVHAFHRVAVLSWMTVVLLVADVLVGWARRDRGARGAGEPAPDAERVMPPAPAPGG